MANPAPAPPKLRLGYCDLCSPVVPLAVGPLPAAPQHFDPKSRKMHGGKLVDIDPSEKMADGESPAAFLARMVAKYVTKK
jgi:hypothetical protein